MPSLLLLYSYLLEVFHYSTLNTHLFTQLSAGIGKAQYIYWAILCSVVYMDIAEMVLMSLIVPVLRCEFDMSLAWDTAINVSSFGFSALSKFSSFF